MSLFLSNILVLVTHVYRVFRNPDESVYATSTEGTGGSNDASHHSFFARFRPKRTRAAVGINRLTRLGTTFNRPSNTAPASQTRESQHPSSGNYTTVGTLTTVNSGSMPTQNWEHDLSQNGTHGELSSRELPSYGGCQSDISPDKSLGSMPLEGSRGSVRPVRTTVKLS